MNPTASRAAGSGRHRIAMSLESMASPRVLPVRGGQGQQPEIGAVAQAVMDLQACGALVAIYENSRVTHDVRLLYACVGWESRIFRAGLE
jgi:hypothetical protein